MPGKLLHLSQEVASGWAAHPRLRDYRVVVNMVHRSTIVRSALADLRVAGRSGLSCGFRIDLGALDLSPDAVAKLRFNIGETDEWVEPPDGWVAAAAGRLTVEDLLSEAHRPRAWVDGTTYVDAQQAGLQVETIVDLLYRDYLGRPSDPNGLAHYSAEIRAGAATYDDIRRGFLEADEYLMRRKYLDNAPGSIFSQRIVMSMAARDPGRTAMRQAVVQEAGRNAAQTVVAGDLAVLDGAAFVSEVYRRILLKEADEGGMAHYLHQLHIGVGKMQIIRTIASELEAITAGVRVIGYLAEPAGDGGAR